MSEARTHPATRRPLPRGNPSLLAALPLLLALFASPLAAAEPADLKVDVLRAESYGSVLDVLLRVQVPGERAAQLGPEDFAVFVAPADVPSAEAATPKFRIRRVFLMRLGDAYYLDLRRLPAGVGATACQLVLQVGREGGLLATRHLPRLLEPAGEELDVALVIDESLSMRRTDPERLRVEAAKTFVDLARRSTRIARIAVIGFDDRVRLLAPFTPPSEADALYKAIDRTTAIGQTDMDGGLGLAREVLEKSPASAKAVVLLSDGKDEPGRYEDSHRLFADRHWRIYTVGLSDRADAEVLQRIARDTGGEYHEAPTNAELQDIFGRICLTLQKKVPIRSRTLLLTAGQAASDTVQVDDTISALTLSLKAQDAGVRFSLGDPAGQAITPETARPELGASYGSKGPYQYYDLWRVAAGPWLARLEAPRADEVTVAATAVTPLLLRAYPVGPSLYRGEPLEIAASLAASDSPLADARVEALVTTADGRSAAVQLHDDGRHGDTGPADGVFAGVFPGSDRPGPCTIRLVATGKTPGGYRFEREIGLATVIGEEGYSRLWCSARGIDFGILYAGESGSQSFDLKLATAVAGAAAETIDVALQPPALAGGKPLPTDALRLTPTPLRLEPSSLVPVTLAVTVPPGQPLGVYTGQLALAGRYDKATLPIRLEVREPKLVLDKERLDLGELESGSRALATLGLRVEPRGSFAAQITASDPRLSVAPARLTVGPGAASAQITLAPPAEMPTGDLRATLTVETPLGKREVPVAAHVVQPTLGLSPQALDFGEAKPGETVERRLALRLEGIAPRQAVLAAQPLANGAETIPLAPPATVDLVPGKDAAAMVGLRVPPAQPPGAYTGRLTVRTPLGERTVPCSVRVSPVATFSVAPSLDFEKVAAGSAKEVAVEVTSLADAEQKVTVALPPPGADWRLEAAPASFVLPPRGKAQVTLRLAAAAAAKPGERQGRVVFRGPSLGAEAAVRALLFRPPHQTLAFEPSDLDVGRLQAGVPDEVSVRLRSLVDEDQRVVIGRTEAPGAVVALAAGPTEFDLPAGGEQALRLTLKPAEKADEVAFEGTVTARGRSEPASLSVRGVVFTPPGATFTAMPAVLDFGSLAAGTSKTLPLAIESTFAREQKISFGDAPRAEGVALGTATGGLLLPAHGIQSLPIELAAEPDATLGERRLTWEVRGPGDAATFEVKVQVVEPSGRIAAPPTIASKEPQASDGERGLTLFLLLALLLAFLVLAYLLGRWLVRSRRVPRMAKYFAMSALIHAVALFTALDLFIAHKVQQKEIGPIFKVGLKAIAGSIFSSQKASVADEVQARRELERQVEAMRRQQDAARMGRERLEAQTRKLDPAKAKLDRPEAQEKPQLAQTKPELKKLSLKELTDILEELKDSEKVKVASKTQAQEAERTDPERLAKVRAMSRDRLEAALTEAMKPKAPEAQKPKPLAEPTVPDLDRPKDSDKVQAKLETLLPALEDLKSEMTRATEDAGGQGALASREIGATKAESRAAAERQTEAVGAIAVALARPGAASRPAVGRPTPQAELAPVEGTAAERRAAPIAIEAPEEAPSAALPPAPAAGRATAHGEAEAAAVAVAHQRAGAASAPARSAEPPASRPALTQAHGVIATRTASPRPTAVADIAPAAEPSLDRVSAPVAIQTPDEKPAADALVDLPRGPAAPAEAEAIPVAVRHQPAGGARTFARQPESAASSAGVAQARAIEAARAEPGRPAAATQLASSETPPSQRQAAPVPIETPEERVAVSAPAAGAAGSQTRPAAEAAAVEVSRGPARAGREQERPVAAAALPAGTASPSPGTKAAPPDRPVREAGLPAIAAASAASKQAPRLEDFVLVEGPPVLVQPATEGRKGESLGPQATVARWQLRRRSEGEDRLVMAAGGLGRLAPRAARADRPSAEMAIGAPEAAPAERQEAPIAALAPEEQVETGPRLAVGSERGEAADEVASGRAATKAEVERVGGGPAAEALALRPREAAALVRSVQEGALPAPGPRGEGKRLAAGVDQGMPEEAVEAAPLVSAPRAGERLVESEVAPLAPAPRAAVAAARSEAAEAGQPALEARETQASRTLSRRASLLLLPGIERETQGAGAVVGSEAGGASEIVMTTAQYGGEGVDWDTHKTMMDFLGFQLRERVGFNIDTKVKVERFTSPGILRSPWVFMTGHKSFELSQAEVAGLRRYLLAGGTLWAEDCTHETDPTWDTAFRREIARVLPPADGYELRKITKAENHPLFRSCFDLSDGFKGYWPPPGDKYRENFLEGVEINGRLAVIYTRNDYGCGLEIKPDTFPVRQSLSGLSPMDMQESSFLMASNIILYVLTGGRGAAGSGVISRAAESLRRRREESLTKPDEYAGLPATLFENFAGENWLTEDQWDQAGTAQLSYIRPADPKAEGRRLAVRFHLDRGQAKVVFIRELPEERDLSGRDRCYIDFESRLEGIARVSLALVTMPEWKYFESVPAVIKPGRSRVHFDLHASTWKTGEPPPEGQTEYCRPVQNLSAVRRFIVLIYPIQNDGTLVLDRIEFKTKP